MSLPKLALVALLLCLPHAQAKEEVVVDGSLGSSDTRMVCLVDEPDWELSREIPDYYVEGRRVTTPEIAPMENVWDRLLDPAEIRFEDGTVIFDPDDYNLERLRPPRVDEEVGPYTIETPDPSLVVPGLKVCLIFPA